MTSHWAHDASHTHFTLYAQSMPGFQKERTLENSGLLVLAWEFQAFHQGPHSGLAECKHPANSPPRISAFLSCGKQYFPFPSSQGHDCLWFLFANTSGKTGASQTQTELNSAC